MDLETKKQFDKHKKRKIPPLWYFSGVIFLISLFIYSRVSAQSKISEIKGKLQGIEKNRIIDFKTEEQTYSTMRVCEVTEGMVKVVTNQFQVDEERFLSQIDEKNNYAKDTSEMDLKVLNQWIDENKVLDIHW